MPAHHRRDDDTPAGRAASDEPDPTACLEARIAAQRVAAPPELDARVAALLDASTGGSVAALPPSAGRTSARPRVWRAAAAALLLAAAALATSVAVRTGDDAPRIDAAGGDPARDGTTAADAALAPAAAVPLAASRERRAPGGDGDGEPGRSPPPRYDDGCDDWDPAEPEAPLRTTPRNLDLRATFERAPVVARVITVDRIARAHSDGRSFDRPVVRVEHVYSGDPALLGRRVELHRHVGIPHQKSFLGWSELDPDVCARRTSHAWITTFAPLAKEPWPDGTLHGQQLFVENWGGALLAFALRLPPEPSSDPALGRAHLVSDLVASLEQARIGDEVEVEISVVAALCHLDAGPDEVAPADSPLWRDDTARAELLLAGRHPFARVRRDVARLNPFAAGDEGVVLAGELLFDPEPMVRDAARRWVERDDHSAAAAARRALQEGVAELDELRAAVEDDLFEELTTGSLAVPTEFFDCEGLAAHVAGFDAPESPRARIERICQLADIQEQNAVAALLRTLGDPEPAVRRAAARVLASAGGPEVRARLHDVPGHEEPRVQAMVACAQLAHGDERGGERLRRVLAGDDGAARCQAVRLLGTHRDGSSAGLRAAFLLEACEHADPLVRGEALVALGRNGGALGRALAEPARLDQLLERAKGDASAYVRAAAQVASAARHVAPRQRASPLEQLGYVGYTQHDSSDDR